MRFWVTTNKILLAVHAKTPATSTKNVLLKREIFLVSLLTFEKIVQNRTFYQKFHRKNEKSERLKIKLIGRKLQKTWWWKKWRNLSLVVSLAVGRVFYLKNTLIDHFILLQIMHLDYRSNASESVKPKKLDMSKQNFLERAKQEEAEKIAEERRRRNEEDRKLREKWVDVLNCCVLNVVSSRELHAAESDGEEEVKENEKLVRKPSKLTITAEDFAAKQEAARQKKLELERRKRQEEDRLRMEAERENYVSDEEIESQEVEKKEVTVNKLKISLKDLESQRDQAALGTRSLKHLHMSWSFVPALKITFLNPTENYKGNLKPFNRKSQIRTAQTSEGGWTAYASRAGNLWVWWRRTSSH